MEIFLKMTEGNTIRQVSSILGNKRGTVKMSRDSLLTRDVAYHTNLIEGFWVAIQL
jgi:hypothetical protein